MPKAPYLGKIKLFWHQEYNIPIIDKSLSPNVRPVNITPPGDVRPAFKGDYEYIYEAIREIIFDGEKFCNYPILLNSIPDIDRMDEIIVDGIILGRLRFNLDHWKFDFFPSSKGAKVLLGFLYSKYKGINKVIKRTRHVIVDNLAAEYIAKGRNVLAPGIISSSNFKKGEYVLIFSENGFFIGVGKALMNSDTIQDINKGTVLKRKVKYGIPQSFKSLLEEYNIILKLRDKLDSALRENEDLSLDIDRSNLYDEEFDPLKLFPQEIRRYWYLIVKFNLPALKKNEKNAIDFIKAIVRQYPNKNYIVSLSGGKDSAVTLELVIRSNIEFTVAFIDTGIELPETKSYAFRLINKIRDLYHDDLILDNVSDYLIRRSNHSIVISAPEETFWNGVSKLGYPAMDWRWCCKSNKLAPARIISEIYFNSNLINFEGIRKYESFIRSREGRISKNIWTNQINVYPIYDWSALELWLYIFWRSIPINPLYGKGLTRIGCYPCPSSNMADFYVLRNVHPELFKKVRRHVLRYREENDEKFFEQGSWRWLDPPKKVIYKNRLKRPVKEIIKKVHIDGDLIKIKVSNNIDIATAIKYIKVLFKEKVTFLHKNKLKKSS